MSVMRKNTGERADLAPCLVAGRIEAGVDEAGRGCIAGPVTAAAVILPPDFRHPLLNDSKQLSAETRQALRVVIEQEALAWAVCFVDQARIDQINILQATFEAMHGAVDLLALRPDFLLIDGNRFRPYPGIPHSCQVKGDARFLSIAAASVLAKTHRDAQMQALAVQYPGYGWEQNAGYPTAAHRRAVAALGPTPLHRMSFNLLGKTDSADTGLLF